MTFYLDVLGYDGSCCNNPEDVRRNVMPDLMKRIERDLSPVKLSHLSVMRNRVDIWQKTKDFIIQQKFAEFQKAKGNLTLWPDGSYLPFDTPTIQSPNGVVGPGTKQEIA